jgi:hypothetical protein
LQLFRDHHTQLNEFYWAHAAALRHAFAATRPFQRSDPVSTLFSLPGIDSIRLPQTLGDWGKHYGGFDNWIRLNALVGITGYFEVYLKTVTRLALESDPGLLVGATRAIDGARLLKQRSLYSYSDQVLDVVRGTWGSRLAAYGRLFGHVPASLSSSLAALERLRKVRNGAAHTFGRAADDYDSIAEARTKPLTRVEETYLKSTLGLVNQLAADIDAHLGYSHIGEYETLYMYHRWQQPLGIGSRARARMFKQHVGPVRTSSRSIQFFEKLIEHYDRA